MMTGALVLTAAWAVSGVSVEPAPNPPDDPRPHRLAIRAEWMTSPVLLRFPETINTSTGLLQIDHYREDMIAKTEPESLAGWKVDDDGTVSFEWELADGFRAGGSARPSEEHVDLSFWVANGSETPSHVMTQFCLVLTDPDLCDRAGERTFVHTGGVWRPMAETDRGKARPELVNYPVVGGIDLSNRPEDAGGWGKSSDLVDVPLVCVQHPDGRHMLGLAWEHPATVLSNWLIPCVHTDPIWPECPAGGRVEVRGRIYVVEGTLDDLLKLCRRDFPTASEGS